MQGHTKNDVTVYEPVNSKVIAFERKHSGENLLILLNFDKSIVPYKVNENILNGSKILDSSSLEWKGSGEFVPERIEAGQELLLPSESVVIFEFTN